VSLRVVLDENIAAFRVNISEPACKQHEVDKRTLRGEKLSDIFAWK